MARPFSHKSAAALEVGGTCFESGPASIVKRRMKEFAARCNPPRQYRVTRAPDGDAGPVAVVHREPDPQP